MDPYLDERKGFRSPGYRIEMEKDYWRVMLARFVECQSFVQSLPLRHQEKVSKKALAQGQSWEEVGPKVQAVRNEIKSARDEFVREAERTYMANPRHQVRGNP